MMKSNRPRALVLLTMAAALLMSCTGTVSAYRAASSPSDYAYVVTEHYAALLREAATLRTAPTTPAAAIDALRKADLAVRPYVLGSENPPRPSLRSLAESYEKAKNAKTQEELQRAIDEAVVKLAALVQAVNAARR